MAEKLKIGVILASVRPGRQGERVAKWLEAGLAAHPELEPEIIDLKEWELPFFSEAMPPSVLKGNYSVPRAKEWAAKVASFSSFIIVTPEYNYSFPAQLKNALDYCYDEWKEKPIGVVSYSMTPGGGIRAAEQLRPVLARLGAFQVPAGVSIPKVHEAVSEAGQAPEFDPARDKLLHELARWGSILQKVRAAN